MNRIHHAWHARRAAGILAGLAGALLASSIAAPAASAATSPAQAWPSWADPPLPPGWHNLPPPGHVAHAAVIGGMPGWQIAVLTAGAALAAPAVAVLWAWGGPRAATRPPVPPQHRTHPAHSGNTSGSAAPGQPRARRAPLAGQKHPS